MNEIVLWGCLGGLIPDVLRFIKNMHELPEQFYGRWNFWVGLLFLIALGGLSAYLLNAADPKQALAYGFGAPEIISKLLSKSGGIDRGAGDFNLRHWWRG
jgi:hypothetical protein